MSTVRINFDNVSALDAATVLLKINKKTNTWFASPEELVAEMERHTNAFFAESLTLVSSFGYILSGFDTVHDTFTVRTVRVSLTASIVKQYLDWLYKTVCRGTVTS
jgi:hypothetical protein